MNSIAVALHKPIVRGLGGTLVFAGLTAAVAPVSLRLGFTPVPITLQVLIVVLSGMVLGSKLGALAQLEYLIAGLAGAPVFAGCHGGLVSLLGPSGGYLPGFVLGAFLTGLVFERFRKPDMPRALAAGMAGVAAIYLCGAAWLSVWLRIFPGPWHGVSAWLIGTIPFIGVDALKVTIAAMIVTGKTHWKR